MSHDIPAIFCHFTSLCTKVFAHYSLTLTSLYTDNFLFFLMMTSYQMSVCHPETQVILRKLAAELDSLSKDVTILAKPALTTILELTQSLNHTQAAAIDFLKQRLSRLDSSSRVLKNVSCPIFSLRSLWARLALTVMIIDQCPWYFPSPDGWDSTTLVTTLVSQGHPCGRY